MAAPSLEIRFESGSLPSSYWEYEVLHVLRLHWLLPFALAAVLIELVWRLAIARKGYNARAAAATLAVAVGHSVFEGASAIVVVAIMGLVARLSPLHWPLQDWRTWIVGFFVVKHLLIPWQEGERWFWDTLVDADLANNAMNWQWVAGCGTDAAPYFRIFNPILQGEKFDPDGRYVRQWVPEIAALPDAYIHKPWTSPQAVRLAAGIELQKHYPAPIVDHAMARRRALDAFSRLKTRQ